MLQARLQRKLEFDQLLRHIRHIRRRRLVGRAASTLLALPAAALLANVLHVAPHEGGEVVVDVPEQ
jgi:hypothetical protein